MSGNGPGKSDAYFQKGRKAGITPTIIDQNPSYQPLPKIFEKCVCDQLSEYLNAKNLLSHCQSGFRSLHSTLTALVDAANSWSVNIDNGLVNDVVFIDLKKAFGTIDYNILLQKLHIYGVDLSLVFSAEVRGVVLLASCLMLHRFLVAFHKVATFDHSYS